MQAARLVLLLLLPLSLVSCSVARRAGGEAAEGAIEYLKSPEGQDRVLTIVEPLVEKGISKLEEEQAKLKSDVEDGTASPKQIGLYSLISAAIYLLTRYARRKVTKAT